MSALAAPVFEERIEPGRAASMVLAAAVHIALFSVLVFGVRWQNRPPESIVVEIWTEPVPVEAEPKTVPKPEPAPAVKPEPVIEKPDIAVRKEPEKAKAVAKPEPPKPRVDEAAQKRMREELSREQASFAVEREREQLREQLARDAAAVRSKGLAEYEAKIRAKVRGNIVLPPELAGNPEAVFLVVQLPTGEVLSTRLSRSSGHQGCDDAVERAILKSSPLPRPERSEFFSRELKLTFRPKD